ncbi:hypothetical protein HHK36_016604 [Tetracentron sinense]|uniref:Uncharacterized protein n=1 Tax=Tetracentron sinense TaxID=13715 RepID=A0A835DB43_TETSI|nr:hypothetical protein HHK36_016604 [Tetracentron sinense]
MFRDFRQLIRLLSVSLNRDNLPAEFSLLTRIYYREKNNNKVEKPKLKGNTFLLHATSTAIEDPLEIAPVPAPESGGDSPASASSPSIKPPEFNHPPSDDTPPSTPSGSSGGLRGGQKAGIALGVIFGAGLVGFGGIVYKKRRANIRRSRYGYATRRAFL